jgi:hypothetical protein
MSDADIDSMDNLIKRFANTYGFERSTQDISKLKDLVLIASQNTGMFLIEDNIADIDASGIQIHLDKRDIFCINRFKTITYNSKDPTFRIVKDDGVYIISYIYNGKKYCSMPMDSYDVDIVSNYGFFHDIIFSYVLTEY